jgi:putative acetyltransferase
VTIRAERPDDYAAIDVVVGAAFGSPSEVRLVNAIRASAFAITELSLVAEQDRRVVGHVMISFAEVVGGAERRAIAMLSPLAVAPEKQRQGLSADAAVPRGAVVYPPAFDTVTER